MKRCNCGERCQREVVHFFFDVEELPGYNADATKCIKNADSMHRERKAGVYLGTFNQPATMIPTEQKHLFEGTIVLQKALLEYSRTTDIKDPDFQAALYALDVIHRIAQQCGGGKSPLQKQSHEPTEQD